MPDIVHDTAVSLSTHVLRVTAANAGIMTGSGTNSYIIGDIQGAGPLAVIDPGPALPAHIDALLAACGERLQHILVTHTHGDHSPAATVLKTRTGARLYGMSIEQDGFQDRSFIPDTVLHDGEILNIGSCTVQAIHTPGHVGNHLCYWLTETRQLFTGDHLINGSTVVIIPPGGSMRDYLSSLKKLEAWPVGELLPGHGDVISDGPALIAATWRHRIMREKKVLSRMRDTAQPCTLDTLVKSVYDDVPPMLHPIAMRSLHAHLIKLEEDGMVRSEGEKWFLF